MSISFDIFFSRERSQQSTPNAASGGDRSLFVLTEEKRPWANGRAWPFAGPNSHEPSIQTLFQAPPAQQGETQTF